MPTKPALLAAWARLLLSAVLALTSLAVQATPADTPRPASKQPVTNEAPIEFWNRFIVMQRAVLAGASPQERAERAAQHISEIPLSVKPEDISVRQIKIEDQDGFVFVCAGRVLFFLGANDLDKESGETLESALQAALRNLAEALQARTAERSWPVIRAGILFTAIGLAVLFLLCFLIWKAQRKFLAFVDEKRGSLVAGWPVFGIDVLPYFVAILRSLVRLVVWLITLTAVYLWVTLSLRRFPYTEPWGYQAGSYVLQLLRDLANKVLFGIPGFLTVLFIFLVTRWLIRMARAVFAQIASGSIRVSWMDADVAQATERIFAAIAWIFAVIVAYPYIPGSQTDAFKGISVFIGLVVSLGSTGIINQIMSGLFVVYSKALKTGEWVKVNDVEGEVLEVGLLAAKIRTIEGQEVTMPNSILVGTSTTNYTRLGYPDGMIISSTVTIGYEAPWRQVHALLLRAAGCTPNVRKDPQPYVLQRQLSDFYVEYTLIARIDDPKLRIETISDLHAQIQDAFNEFGVQIMSPHYMVQPENTVIVPPSKWHPAPTPSKR